MSNQPDSALDHPIKEHEEDFPEWAQQKKKKKAYKIMKLIKRYFLLLCWITFTALLIIFSPRVFPYKVYSLSSTKPLVIDIGKAEKGRVGVHLLGPFTYEDHYANGEVKGPKLKINLIDESGKTSPVWTVHLVKPERFDKTRTLLRSDVLNLGQKGNKIYLTIQATDPALVSFQMAYNVNPVPEPLSPILAICLLILLKILLTLDLVHRTLGMIFICSFALGFMALFKCIPPLYLIVRWIDFEIMLMVFGMTIVMSITKESGLIDYLAVRCFELSHGHIWPTMNFMMFIAFSASLLIGNIPVVMMLTPLLIRLCEIMALDPVPVLICITISSHLGAMLTPYGDMPATIIAQNEPYIKVEYPYFHYLLHIFPGVLLAMIQTYIHLRLLFLNSKKMKYPEGVDAADLKTQILLWRSAAAKISPYTEAEQRLQKTVMARVRNLRRRLERLGKMPEKVEDFETKVKDLKVKYPIKSKKLLIISCIIIGIIVILMGLRPVGHNLSHGWIAILLSIVLILLVEMEEHIEPLFMQIEWATLLCIAAIYVLAKTLDGLQFYNFVARGIEKAIVDTDNDYKILVGITVIIVTSAAVSCLIAGIPTTTLAMQIIHHLAENKNANVPAQPMIWSLTYGIALGSMGTLIGSIVNIVVAGNCEKHGHKFFILRYLTIAFPVMLLNIFVAACYLYVAHVACAWH